MNKKYKGKLNNSSKWQYWIKILSIWVVQILGKTLVEEERKYPCLWDEWNKGYKEKDRKVNARNALAEDTGVEQGSRSNYLIFAYKSYVQMQSPGGAL